MSEVKVTKEKKEELIPWPEFEAPFLRSDWFRMNPFSLMHRFGHEMDRFFNRKFPESGVWAPPIELKVEKGKMMVTAELPGMRKQDVKVNISPEGIVLEGERKTEKEEKREGYYHSERAYGRFYRSIPLPEGAVIDNATAEFHDGMLEVTVPVPEVKSRTREVPVNEPAKAA